MEAVSALCFIQRPDGFEICFCSFREIGDVATLTVHWDWKARLGLRKTESERWCALAFRRGGSATSTMNRNALCRLQKQKSKEGNVTN